VAPILFASIAEALARIDIRKNNEYHAPFPGDYSITSKSTRASECDVALERYRRYEFISDIKMCCIFT